MLQVVLDYSILHSRTVLTSHFTTHGFTMKSHIEKNIHGVRKIKLKHGKGTGNCQVYGQTLKHNKFNA